MATRCAGFAADVGLADLDITAEEFTTGSLPGCVPTHRCGDGQPDQRRPYVRDLRSGRFAPGVGSDSYGATVSAGCDEVEAYPAGRPTRVMIDASASPVLQASLVHPVRGLTLSETLVEQLVDQTRA